MSIPFWSTVRPRTGDVSYGTDKHSDEHAVSLISPNAREIVERSEEGVSLYNRDPHHDFLLLMVCQLRVAESLSTAERFIHCSFYWGERSSDVASTGRRSALTMRQFAVRGIGLPPCFDWWINRYSCHLPLSLVIKTHKELVHLPEDRYGDSLVSLTLDGQTALHNIQSSGALASVRTLWLTHAEMVTADDLHRFPNMERLYLRNGMIDMSGMRVDLVGSQTPGGSNALSPCKRLQHLFIHDCSNVRLPELPMLFLHLHSLGLRGSRLESPLHFPPKMPQLTHLDLLAKNPELIGQPPHCRNLRFLALQDLDITVLRTILHGSKSLRHLEGRINNAKSFDITSWEPFIDVLEVLHINDSPQLRNLVFSTCDSLLHLMSLDVSGNSQLRTLDISGCVNLTKLDCCSCSQLRDVGGLAGLDKLEKLYTYCNDSITSLDVSGCVSLADLQFDRCTQFSNVVGLARLANLQRLHAYENPKLTSLDVSGCVSLAEFACYGCPQLTEIVGVAGLLKLERLRTQENPKLTSLDVSGCVSLAEFACYGCPQLTEIVGVAGLLKLERLRTQENPKLTSLDVNGCVSLAEFACYGCPQLTGILGFADLGNLEKLLTHENPMITSLDVSGCVSLKQLQCQECVALTAIVGLAGLENLETLYAYENPQVTSLDVSGCVSLAELTCHGCPQLHNVAGLDDNPDLNWSVCRQLARNRFAWRSLL